MQIFPHVRSVGFVLLVLGLTAASLVGCRANEAPAEPLVQTRGPDYGRELPPGASALRRLDRMDYPDLEGPFRDADHRVRTAIDQSLSWFAAPSSRQFFPFEGFTHDQARESLVAFREILDSAATAADFEREVYRRFDVYQSVGWNGRGTVLFTGYFSPVFDASPVRTSRFTAPLYTRPDDLVTDPTTGEPLGRRVASGRIEPWPTRRTIESTRMFAGNELVWVEDKLSAYIIHVNGSAKLRMPDGSARYIGYAGKTDRPYSGLGKRLLDAGVVSEDELSLSAIRKLYRTQQATIDDLILDNESYVFFTEYDGDAWPSGSLGVPVTTEATLATDKKIYPRGGVVLVDTQAVSLTRGKEPFQRFMLDQDTGGAIRAPGRADIFMGIGPTAEILAGGQYAEGELYYFMLKPERYVRR